MKPQKAVRCERIKKKLPTLEELRGSLKNLAKEKSTEKIVRRIKEGWIDCKQ